MKDAIGYAAVMIADFFGWLNFVDDRILAKYYAYAQPITSPTYIFSDGRESVHHVNLGLMPAFPRVSDVTCRVTVLALIITCLALLSPLRLSTYQDHWRDIGMITLCGGLFAFLLLRPYAVLRMLRLHVNSYAFFLRPSGRPARLSVLFIGLLLVILLISIYIHLPAVEQHFNSTAQSIKQSINRSVSAPRSTPDVHSGMSDREIETPN